MQKIKYSISMTVFITGLLIFSSSLNLSNLNALVEKEYSQYTVDSFDRSDWKWNPTKVLSTESTLVSGVPSLAVDSEANVHVVWSDLTDYDGCGGDWDVFYKRWDISSSSWTITEVVSSEVSSTSVFPSIAVDSSGDVHIAWQDYSDYGGSGALDSDIFYRNWDSSIYSWTTTEVVSTESTDYSGIPSIATDSAGDVHIAWQDRTDYAGAGTDGDIFYKFLNVSSTTWTTTEVVSTESMDDASESSLVVDSAGDVHIAWSDDTNYAGAGTDEDIFYKQWNASSSSWTITEVISTESTNDSTYPALDVDSAGNVHLAWDDYTNYAGAGTDQDIFYKHWNASSSSWTITEVISTEFAANSSFPSLAIDSDMNVHLTWFDYIEAAGNGIDIYYRYWESSLSKWTSTVVISTESTGRPIAPFIDVDSTGIVHIAWDDITDYDGSGADRDIFYKFFAGPPSIAPELAFIVPNPTDIDSLYLDWNNISQAINYFVYRSDYYIWSVEDLVPITTVTSSYYTDLLPSEGYFYYVIVAGNAAGNSSHSNCQYVEYKIPHVREFTIISGLILGAMVVSLVIMKTRKNKIK